MDLHLDLHGIARTIAVPKDAPADSFVLHAPLELLARVLLLDRLAGADRGPAVERLTAFAAAYESAGDPVAPPGPYDVASPAEGCADLVVAIANGDLERVDAIASWLDTHATPADLRRHLAAAVLPSLAAAGHAPILLALLPRVGGLGTNLLRGPARELARDADWRLTWFDDADADADDDAPEPPDATTDPVDGVGDALLDVPRLGSPGSDFIFPIMSQAESSGVARSLLGPLVTGITDPPALARRLALVASWSMLQEGPDHVPYGWTHCLTMPQAALDLAPEAGDRAGLVAATHVVGFRAALGTRPLEADAEVVAPVPAAELVAYGAGHADAHVVKHTLAALDAAAADPAHAGVHLAASARLQAWWGADNGRFA